MALRLSRRALFGRLASGLTKPPFVEDEGRASSPSVTIPSAKDLQAAIRLTLFVELGPAAIGRMRSKSLHVRLTRQMPLQHMS
jgi:hypothetical protein